MSEIIREKRKAREKEGGNYPRGELSSGEKKFKKEEIRRRKLRTIFCIMLGVTNR